jgi:hypothetical protein
MFLIVMYKEKWIFSIFVPLGRSVFSIKVDECDISFVGSFMTNIIGAPWSKQT